MKMRIESELKQIAEASSKTIVIREYINGNSRDVERIATKAESKIIYNLLFGALLGMNWSYGKSTEGNKEQQQAIIDTAEYTAGLFLPTANNYDTIYLRLKSIVNDLNK